MSGESEAKTRTEKARKGRAGKIARRVVLAVVVVFLVASFAFDRFMLERTYARVGDMGFGLYATYEDYGQDYPRQAVAFELDGSALRGYVYGADNARGLIIFRHGIWSEHQTYLPFITAMVDRGWRVFAYDALGAGQSDGDSTLGMSQSPRDVAAAVAFARESGMADGMGIALWGHSWGGYGVAAALGREGVAEEVFACVAMSGYDTPMKVIVSSARQIVGPLAYTQVPTLWLNTVLAFGLGDADASASRAVAESGVPTLLVHGVEDATVPYRGVSTLGTLQAAPPLPGNVSFVLEDEPGRDGHADYFYAPESQTYFNACAAELMALDDEDARAAYLAGVDRLRANTADPELMDQIDAFLAQAMGQG